MGERIEWSTYPCPLDLPVLFAVVDGPGRIKHTSSFWNPSKYSQIFVETTCKYLRLSGGYKLG